MNNTKLKEQIAGLPDGAELILYQRSLHPYNEPLSTDDLKALAAAVPETPEGCTPYLDLLAQRNALTETNIQLEEQLAEAKGKVERFEAMLGSVSELCFDDPSADICHNDNGTWTAVTHRPRLSLNGPHPDALTAFEAIQEGRDGELRED